MSDQMGKRSLKRSILDKTKLLRSIRKDLSDTEPLFQDGDGVIALEIVGCRISAVDATKNTIMKAYCTIRRVPAAEDFEEVREDFEEEDIYSTRILDSKVAKNYWQWHWDEYFEVHAEDMLTVTLNEWQSPFLGFRIVGSYTFPASNFMGHQLGHVLDFPLNIAEPLEKVADHSTVFMRVVPLREKRQIVEAVHLAELDVHLHLAADLPSSRPYHAILRCGEKILSSHNSTSTRNPIWDRTFRFRVLSFTDDLRIVIKEKGFQGKSATNIGQVVVPINQLLEGFQPKQRFTDWYELYPVIKAKPHNRYGQYIAARDKIRSYGFGLPRPDKPLGFIKLTFSLKPNIAVALWPLAANVKRSRGAFALETEMSQSLIKVNIRRLKRKLRPEMLLLTVKRLRQWEGNKFCTALLFGFLLYASSFASIWELPFLHVIDLILLGMITRSFQSFDYVAVYEDEVAHPRYDPVSKVQKMIRIILKFQTFTGKAASACEKLCNLIMFSDIKVSAVFFVLLFLFSLVCALILWFFSPEFICTTIVAFFFLEQPLRALLELFRVSGPKRTIQSMSSFDSVEESTDFDEGSIGQSGFLYREIDVRRVPISGPTPGDDSFRPLRIWKARWVKAYGDPPSLLVEPAKDEDELVITLNDVEVKDLGRHQSVKDMDQMIEELGPDTPRPDVIDLAMNEVQDGLTIRKLYPFELRVKTASEALIYMFATESRSERAYWIRSIKNHASLYNQVKPVNGAQIPSHPMSGHKEISIKQAKIRGSNPFSLADRFLTLLHEIPDDMDLEHRYICQTARMIKGNQELENTEWADYDPIQKSVDTKAKALDNVDMKVTLVAGRNIPWKNAGVIPFLVSYWAEVSVTPTSMCNREYRSSRKSRISNPMWREKFFFRNISFDSSTVNVVLRSNKGYIGRVLIPLKKLDGNAKVYEGWYDIALDHESLLAKTRYTPALAVRIEIFSRR